MAMLLQCICHCSFMLSGLPHCCLLQNKELLLTVWPWWTSRTLWTDQAACVLCCRPGW